VLSAKGGIRYGVSKVKVVAAAMSILKASLIAESLTITRFRKSADASLFVR
jgi:hypothetical protein